MADRGHSPLGASSMYRWSQCPASIRLSRGIEKSSSKYAEEGTEAHAMAEKWLSQGGCPNDCDEEMRENIRVYVEAVLDDAAMADKLLIEHGFDLKDVYPGAWGTADAVIFDQGQNLLRVYDLKYGAGIPVEVKDNPQLMYYGLGALMSTGYPCAEVELVIVQPRCSHPDGPVRRWRLPAVDLMDFATDLVKFARATEDPNAEANPGDWCRFCPAAPQCPAIHSKALDVAKREFSPSFSYDPAKLADTLNWLPILEAWIKNVREFAYGEAEHGRCPPGWKLVEKRATRKWVDDTDKVLDALKIETPLVSDDLFEKKLKSPAAVEKLLKVEGLKKAEIDKVFDGLCSAESSGATLAPESDKRPALRKDPASEFTRIEA